MATSPTTDAERTAEFADRFTPKLVDLSSHGSNITITFLLDGTYYTARRLYPDFTDVADDAELGLTLNFIDLANAPIAAKLHQRRGQIGKLTQEARCEQHIIGVLLSVGRATFGPEFQAYLRNNDLECVEPTNKSYYEAKMAFVTAWHRLAAFISGV